MRYIPLPQAPRNRGFTILLAVLWLALVVYIITHPDVFGIIILVVFTLVVVPMFILAFRLQSDPRAIPDDAHDAHDMHDTPPDDEMDHAENGLN